MAVLIAPLLTDEPPVDMAILVSAAVIQLISISQMRSLAQMQRKITLSAKWTYAAVLLKFCNAKSGQNPTFLALAKTNDIGESLGLVSTMNFRQSAINRKTSN